MWLLLHTAGYSEAEILAVCERRINRNILDDAFCITYDCTRKYQGVWHQEQKNLIPEYVILESQTPKELFREIRRQPELADQKLLPVNQETETFLRRLGGVSKHLPMSEGVIRDGVTHISRGPLQGREQFIIRIDRHKRIAFLGNKSFPKNLHMKTGLEIREKSL